MALLFHTFSNSKRWYVFDANRNSVFSISKEDYKALSEIERGNETPENMAVLRRFQEKDICCDVHIESVKNPDTDIMTEHLGRMVHQITLQVTQRCNLRCSYCAYSDLYENRSHGSRSMSLETAKRAIDFGLARSSGVSQFYIGFYGGEPLLELPLIKECVEYAKAQAPSRDIRFSTTTNGTLLTPDVYEYLVSNDFFTLVSLDGPQPVHDMSRKFADGSGSYDIIVKNLSDIRDKYPDAIEKIMFNAVVNPDIQDQCIPSLFHPNDVISYYQTSLRLLSLLYADTKVTYNKAFSVYNDHEVCKLLLAMVGKLDRKYVSAIIAGQEEGFNTEGTLLNAIARIPQHFHPGGPCLAGAQRLFVDVDGRLFPCERVSENSHPMLIGDLDNGFDFEKVKALINPAQLTEEECKKCWAIMHCNLCAAYSDNLTELSKSKRLSNCRRVRTQYQDTLQTYCFLKEAGYIYKK